MNLFTCPVCSGVLLRQEKSYICPNRHSFDIAREGYVNLLLPGKSNSAVPGDNRDMVNARTAFLGTGCYDPFAISIADIVAGLIKSADGVILDAGCGQGYYDRKIKTKLPAADIYGIDISKFAVKHAASRNKDINYAVAGVYDMPVADGCADVIMSIFSPIAENEFNRVAAKGAYLIIAVPGPRHLFGLKEILYKQPYENDVISTSYEGFEFCERIPIKSNMTLNDNALIMSLFAMTPYYWKTDVEGHERLKSTNKLDSELEFDILVYKKS